MCNRIYPVQCSVQGCEGKSRSLGLCIKHHRRFKRYGDVDFVKMYKDRKFRDFGGLKGVLESNKIIDRNGCWNWSRGKTNGYGILYFNGKPEGVHRLSAKEFLKFKLSSKKMVLHRCDNPSCFNPNHLYIGNQEDDMRDRFKRTGYRKGKPVLHAAIIEELKDWER